MRSIFTLLILFSISFSQAQTRDTIHLWLNKVPGEIAAKHAAIKSDNTSGNVIRLTDITNPSLTVFKPKISNDSKAAIIVCPGGGYSILAVDKEGTEVAEWLNSLGYTAFVLQYRVPNKKQGALQDVQRAIRMVRSKASIYDLNPQKIGVMGFSAGGHLSALASTDFQKESYNKEDTIDKFSSRPNFAMLIYPAYLDKGENRSISPEFVFSNQTPPYFIFGTADDKYGNSSLVMTAALRDHKIPVELHMLPEGGHGYGLRKGNITAETWPILAETWLNRMVKTRAIEKYQRTINFPKMVVYPNSIPKKKDTWVFMLAGQSNMAGRGFVEPQDTISSERILTINKSNELILAKEPLHFYEPTMAGLDCGMSFAKKLLTKVPENVSILLIPTSVGGSSINKWVGDSIHREVKLLSNFKNKAEFAKKYGEIKGVLWHQGESNANKKGMINYEENMAVLFREFRKAVGNKKLPILIGELGSYSKNNESKQLINKKIQNYIRKDENSFFITTSDLKDRGDRVHFNSEGQRIMGSRFADTYFEILNRQKTKND